MRFDFRRTVAGAAHEDKRNQDPRYGQRLNGGENDASDPVGAETERRQRLEEAPGDVLEHQRSRNGGERHAGWRMVARQPRQQRTEDTGSEEARPQRIANGVGRQQHQGRSDLSEKRLSEAELK